MQLVYFFLCSFFLHVYDVSCVRWGWGWGTEWLTSVFASPLWTKDIKKGNSFHQ